MRANSKHTTLTFNPLPPKEGEEANWSRGEWPFAPTTPRKNFGSGLVVIERFCKTAGFNFSNHTVVNKRFGIGPFGLGILPRQEL